MTDTAQTSALNAINALNALGSPLDARTRVADNELANYDFGEGVSVVGKPSWDTSEPDDLTKLVYVEFEDAPADACSKVSFHVRFAQGMEVAEAYGLLVSNGGCIGHRPADKPKNPKEASEGSLACHPGATDPAELLIRARQDLEAGMALPGTFAELIAEVERLRSLLLLPKLEATHRCRACFHSYTAQQGASEDCPHCGSNGNITQQGGE